jgi:hypothetical protein
MATRVVGALAATLAAAFFIFAFYRGAEIFLEPVLGELPKPAGPLAWLTAALPVVACAVLVLVHALLPTLGRTAQGRAFHVHALHGFYFGAVADRLVDRVWGCFAIKGAEHA